MKLRRNSSRLDTVHLYHESWHFIYSNNTKMIKSNPMDNHFTLAIKLDEGMHKSLTIPLVPSSGRRHICGRHIDANDTKRWSDHPKRWCTSTHYAVSVYFVLRWWNTYPRVDPTKRLRRRRSYHRAYRDLFAGVAFSVKIAPPAPMPFPLLFAPQKDLPPRSGKCAITYIFLRSV